MMTPGIGILVTSRLNILAENIMKKRIRRICGVSRLRARRLVRLEANEGRHKEQALSLIHI